MIFGPKIVKKCEDEAIENVLGRSDETELTAFCKYNSDHPDTEVPYISSPEQFEFQKKDKK